MKTLTADRRNQIARILVNEGSAKVGELSKRFGVSTETIRKDIIWLDKEGLAEKSFGGAVAKSELIERTIDDKQSVNSEEKAKIAELAVSLIPEGGAVILDAGSTNLAIAKQLSLKKGFTVFTNSIKIASVLSQSDNDVYIMGGRIRPSSKAAIGGWADHALDSIYADIAFLGSDGFNGLSGPSALSYSEADFKKRVRGAASRVYTVADNSKFNSTGLFAYGDWRDVTGLITDDKAPKNLLGKIKEHTNVLIAH